MQHYCCDIDHTPTALDPPVTTPPYCWESLHHLAVWAKLKSDTCDTLQEKAEAATAPAPPPSKATSKLYLVPRSLAELFGVLEQYANQPDDFRLIAGNTGAGVYHDWPLERVLIDIKAIPELTRIDTSKVCSLPGFSAVVRLAVCQPAVSLGLAKTVLLLVLLRLC